jgi:hypothetical protein
VIARAEFYAATLKGLLNDLIEIRGEGGGFL